MVENAAMRMSSPLLPLAFSLSILSLPAAAEEGSTPPAPRPSRPKEVPAMRRQNLERLVQLGFKVAPGLPTQRSDDPVRLRPMSEVATRLYSLAAVFFWAGVPERMVREDVLLGAMLKGRLVGQTSGEDLEILKLSRAEAERRHSRTVGWRLENMWALAWVLGFDPPPSLGGQIERAVHQKMMFRFLEFPKQSPPWLLKRAKPRSLDEIDRMEDLFYCAHNAVRSAQRGEATVPAGFDPVRDGGAIHERRHALTWVLSPGVDWDEVELDT
jgi:hypothetical protein